MDVRLIAFDKTIDLLFLKGAIPDLVLVLRRPFGSTFWFIRISFCVSDALAPCKVSAEAEKPAEHRTYRVAHEMSYHFIFPLKL